MTKTLDIVLNKIIIFFKKKKALDTQFQRSKDWR